MGEIARALNRKNEIVRSLGRPVSKAFGPLQRIERPIDFDRGKNARGVRKLAFLRQIGRIERAAPSLVSPSRDPYPNRSDAKPQRTGHQHFYTNRRVSAQRRNIREMP